jgi:ribonuclease Z
VSDRELVVLGSASQVPTRHRNHNGYLLRWDGDGILFDPGEGTQRQLAAAGVEGPDVGRLQRAGVLRTADRVVHLEDVSEPRRGMAVAFVMDTRRCPAVHDLADGVDLLVIEATFLHRDAALADEYGHLTVRQAAQVAADCGVGTVVLTHFSQRYDDPALFGAEAAAVFDGEIVVAEDLIRVPLHRR